MKKKNYVKICSNRDAGIKIIKASSFESLKAEIGCELVETFPVRNSTFDNIELGFAFPKLMLLDEEGKLEKREINPIATALMHKIDLFTFLTNSFPADYDYIVGDVILCNIEDGDFNGMTENECEDIKKYLEYAFNL